LVSATPNVADIAKGVAEWLPLFFRPDDALEVRFLHVEGKRTHAGWLRASDIPAQAAAIARVANGAGAAYFTPQQLNPATLARQLRAGKFPARADLTTDADVTGRRYLLIDIDPKRPAGVCATDAEKRKLGTWRNGSHALALAESLSAPLVVDSGNGWHLYYRLPAARTGRAVPDSAADPLAGYCDSSRPSATRTGRRSIPRCSTRPGL
jgi:hypothetical protein